MPKHRGNGEGSISRRVEKRKDGTESVRWVAELMLGYDPDGKPQRWRASGKTRKEVADKLAGAIQDQRRGQLLISSRETVGEYLTRWLPIVEPTVGAKWAGELRRYVAVLVAALGQIELRRLAIPLVQRLLADLQRAGRSAYYVQKVHAVLRHALNDAVGWQLIPLNPAVYAKTPKTERHEVPVWTPEQLARFLAAVQGDDDAELYTLAILTGARAGELCALHWADVDWQRQTISINRSVGWVTGKGLIVKETKTRTSRRLVSLPVEGITALTRQRERLARWGVATPVVFPARSGEYRSADAARRKLARVASAIGLPVLTFHQLRHLSGSLLVALGVDLKIIQARLGHSSVDVTGDIYAHVLPGLDQEAAARLGRLIPADSRDGDRPNEPAPKA